MHALHQFPHPRRGQQKDETDRATDQAHSRVQARIDRDAAMRAAGRAPGRDRHRTALEFVRYLPFAAPGIPAGTAGRLLPFAASRDRPLNGALQSDGGRSPSDSSGRRRGSI